LVSSNSFKGTNHVLLHVLVHVLPNVLFSVQCCDGGFQK
jgi:hypothetical protein